jgi:hypothetical protein
MNEIDYVIWHYAMLIFAMIGLYLLWTVRLYLSGVERYCEVIRNQLVEIEVIKHEVSAIAQKIQHIDGFHLDYIGTQLELIESKIETLETIAEDGFDRIHKDVDKIFHK